MKLLSLKQERYTKLWPVHIWVGYRERLRHLLQGVSVLGITRSVAKQFAIIRGQLRALPHGKALTQPKDKYDLLIAATAISHNLTLITRNMQDYAPIPQVALYHLHKDSA